jgi:phospholipid/cholesterol/gamma-HCH transport system substrate-binding protein
MPSARVIGIGVFVVGGLLLFAGGLFMVGDRRLMFAQQFDVHAHFNDIAGLRNGAAVRVSGMEAGEVTDIAIPISPAGSFRVRMRVRQDLHALVRNDSVASIQTDGLVGNRYVRIEAGSEASPSVADGGTIRSQEPFDFADLMQTASETIEEIGTIVVELRAGLEEAIEHIGEAAVSANQLVNTVGPELEAMSRSGRRILDDTSRIVASVRAGEGTMGQLFTDDELYNRARSVARSADETMLLARDTVSDARAVIADVQGTLHSPEGPTQTVVADLRDTITSTRDAMSNLAETTEAVKRNVLFRGFFEQRGFYDLRQLRAADYRQGVLGGRHREPIRIWLHTDVLFEPGERPDAAAPPHGTRTAREALAADGRARLDLAMAEVLRYPRDTPLIIEGYATADTRDQRFLKATARAEQVREYLVARYALSPNHVSIMPLGDQADRSPEGSTWDGVALAMWVDRRVFTEGR